MGDLLKLLVTVTPEKPPTEKLFIQIEGELSEAQHRGVRWGQDEF